jgi:hypothetical protein
VGTLVGVNVSVAVAVGVRVAVFVGRGVLVVVAVAVSVGARVGVGVGLGAGAQAVMTNTRSKPDKVPSLLSLANTMFPFSKLVMNMNGAFRADRILSQMLRFPADIYTCDWSAEVPTLKDPASKDRVLEAGSGFLL